jgi:hypothetical protein
MVRANPPRRPRYIDQGSQRLVPPALPREPSADTLRATQLVDRNDTRRGIGAARSQALHIEA